MKKVSLIFLVAVICSCTSGGGGGGGGSDCGGATGAVCPDGQYCKYDDQACGTVSGGGSCETIPASCDAAASPVCTCDALTFDNECLAAKAGQSVANAGECP